jgi:hypothetical protein
VIATAPECDEEGSESGVLLIRVGGRNFFSGRGVVVGVGGKAAVLHAEIEQMAARWAAWYTYCMYIHIMYADEYPRSYCTLLQTLARAKLSQGTLLQTVAYRNVPALCDTTVLLCHRARRLTVLRL